MLETILLGIPSIISKTKNQYITLSSLQKLTITYLHCLAITITSPDIGHTSGRLDKVPDRHNEFYTQIYVSIQKNCTAI
jgi:hypothetical protein